MSRHLRRAHLAALATLVFLAWCARVALAHEQPHDANGGHECTQANVDAGLCTPAGSYHCHTQACVMPTDKPPTTSGGPTLADLTGGAAAQASATPVTPTTPAPTAVVTTPAATAQPALGNTGTITDVLGWTGLAVLFFGLALVLFAGPRRLRDMAARRNG